jgi:hypothetical protein
VYIIKQKLTCICIMKANVVIESVPVAVFRESSGSDMFSPTSAV